MKGDKEREREGGEKRGEGREERGRMRVCVCVW